MRDLQAKCLARADECYAIANESFNRTIKRIPIVFSNKLIKTGGYFRYMRSGTAIKIQLSNSILRLNPEEFIADVIGHEIAHHIVNEVFGPREQAHGVRWKRVMQLFGQAPNRTHRMKTESTSTFTYKVGFETIEIGAIRHNKIQSGAAKYTVRGCGQILPSHWIHSVPKDATPYVKPTFPTLTKSIPPRAIGPRNTGSKADIVRQQIREFRAAGFDLQQMLVSGGHVLHSIATAAGLKEGLCKTYIKNNWSKA